MEAARKIAGRVRELNVAATIRRNSCRAESRWSRNALVTCVLDLAATLAASPNFETKARPQN